MQWPWDRYEHGMLENERKESQNGWSFVSEVESDRNGIRMHNWGQILGSFVDTSEFGFYLKGIGQQMEVSKWGKSHDLL